MDSPAFRFYPSDFLSDEHVALMTNQEIGCYLKLLCYCWREGSIPSDLNKIAKLVGEDGSAIAQLWLAIKPCFTKCPDQPDRLYQKRLEIERKKQLEYKLARSAAGKKGAEARHSKGFEAKVAEPKPSSARAKAELSSSLSSAQLELKQSLSFSLSNKKKQAKKEIGLPDWIPKAEWNDYLAMRKEKRKEATARSQKALVKKLEGFRASGLDLAKVITNAIEHGWTGLFAYEKEAQSQVVRDTFVSYPVLTEEEKLASGRAAKKALESLKRIKKS